MVGVALLGYLVALPVLAVTARDMFALALVALLPTVGLGLLVAWRRPASPVGAVLVTLAAAAALTWVVEQVGGFLAPGAWVWQLTGFVLLCLTFPDGLLPGRGWRAMPWLFVAVAVAVDVAVSAQDGSGTTWLVVDLALGAALLAVLAGPVAALGVRYRRGDGETRARLRWLLLGAGSLPLLLAAGWGAQAAGAPVGPSYTGFLLALLVFLPVSVAVAVLRHDILDIDQVLTESVSWLLTTVAAAGVFATVVFGVAETTTHVEGPPLATAAAFGAALVLLPVHRRVHAAVGRVLDRERFVTRVRLQDFVTRVRDGRAEPEEVEQVLRDALGDPGLRLVLRPPGESAYVDLSGERTDFDEASAVPLTLREAVVGAVVPTRPTVRMLRRVRDAVAEVRLPIEVSRLRMELRASRNRLLRAVTEERRALERDLHDGAQQGIVAVGMRLRSMQRGHPGLDADLDAAVAALEDVVAELRRLAHGVRPSRLDDGLEPAIRALVSESPIPVSVSVDDVDVSETVATTVYYVVAECLANTLKHAGAQRAAVVVERAGSSLTVSVSDDGTGGATSGFGLTAMRDRVSAVGGRLAVASPAGAGTTVRAEL